MKKVKLSFYLAIGFIMAFVLWTVLVSCVGVQAIGPNNSKVGLATLNAYFSRFIGMNMALYHITDWLGLVPVAFMLVFAVVGLVQWIKRRAIYKVDCDILVLGVYYLIVFAIYMFFEYVVINYRPVLINGYLEASYPSSTTMLVLCVMPTAIMQLNKWIKNTALKNILSITISVFIVFMVLGRFLSGVHWFSDIVGGILFSAGMVMAYYSACAFCSFIKKQKI